MLILSPQTGAEIVNIPYFLLLMELILMWLTLKKGLVLVENGTYLEYHVVMGLHVFGLTIKTQMIMYLIGTG
jgi:hypothetical protein